MRTIQALLVLATAAAAGLAAVWVADWVAGAAAATAALMVMVMGMALVSAAAAERFLAEAEAREATDAEKALAARVGLDPVTVLQAKAAAKAAVRATMVRRGAGLAALCAARAPAAVSSARVKASAARVSVGAESSAPETAAESATSRALAPGSPSEVVLGLAELSAGAAPATDGRAADPPDGDDERV